VYGISSAAAVPRRTGAGFSTTAATTGALSRNMARYPSQTSQMAGGPTTTASGAMLHAASLSEDDHGDVHLASLHSTPLRLESAPLFTTAPRVAPSARSVQPQFQRTQVQYGTSSREPPAASYPATMPVSMLRAQQTQQLPSQHRSKPMEESVPQQTGTVESTADRDRDPQRKAELLDLTALIDESLLLPEPDALLVGQRDQSASFRAPAMSSSEHASLYQNQNAAGFANTYAPQQYYPTSSAPAATVTSAAAAAAPISEAAFLYRVRDLNQGSSSWLCPTRCA